MRYPKLINKDLKSLKDNGVVILPNFINKANLTKMGLRGVLVVERRAESEGDALPALRLTALSNEQKKERRNGPKEFESSKDELNISERISKEGLYLPLGKSLKKSQQEFIVNSILKII